jgi:SPP1 gp7 family putative phage head morphogenesis protein
LASGEAREQLAQLADELPVRLEMELPPAELLRSIVVDRPFEGRTTRGWWTKVADTEKSGYARAVQQGLVQGETVPQIVGRITGRKGVTQLAERQATAVVRTAVNHTSGHARDATYRANADLLRGVQIVATLDSRTTPICWSMDGKVFPVGEGPRPPFHYNCRTTTVPLVKGFEELDVDAQRVPAASRASWRGQVPARLSYPEWFLGQPEWFQEKVLGPRRFALFRAGLEDLRQFVDTQGRLYTLDELYVRYPEAAAAAAHVPAASVLPVATAVARRALQERLDAIELPTAAPATPAEVAEFRATMDRVGRLVQAAGTAAAAAGLSTSETADAIRALQQRVMPFIRALRAFLAGLPINTLRLFAREAGIAVWRTATRESLLAILTELDKARAMTIERAVARLT